MWWFKRTRRVPRKYLKPRPMASPARGQHPFWDHIPVGVMAVLVAAAIAYLGPFAALDRHYTAFALDQLGSSQPSKSVIVVNLSARAARQENCASSLERVVREGAARALLHVPPADAFCAAPHDNWHVLSLRSLNQDDAGHVLGFHPTRMASRQRLPGINEAEWVAPRAWRSVPAVGLVDLSSGRVASSVLRDRIAVVTLEDPVADVAGKPSVGTRVAAALSAAIEDGPRQVGSRTLVAGMVLLVGLLWYASSRPRRRQRLGLAGKYAILAVNVVFIALGMFALVPLVPLPSYLGSLAICFGAARLPRFLAARRAEQGTQQLLQAAKEAGSQAPHALPDEVFWQRLARRVAAAHPADGVLIAELPPFSWRLKVHRNGELNESIIRERRRDIRRFPYTSDDGSRKARVTSGFVVTQVPTVLVPLEVSGEVEGYFFLIGSTAEDAFVERPELTRQLAADVAQLIRRRRLEQLKADEWRRPAGVLVHDPSQRSQSLLAGARAALDRLRLYGDVLNSTSVGLLYADAFGDVRVLSEGFSRHLAVAGLEVPDLGRGDSLDSGALPLARVIQAFADASGQKAPMLDELTTREVAFEVDLSGDSGDRRMLRFAVCRLETEQYKGFVGSVIETKQEVGAASNVERLPEARDPLTVFSLAQLLVDVVASASRRTGGAVKLQTPRVMAHVLGHRRALASAIEEFLVDSVQHDTAHAGPSLLIRERQHRVELTILDVRLGVPVAAARRTLLAPSNPPPGMKPLGSLTGAVENSHGAVSMRNDEGWGFRLTISLVRARPRLEPGAQADVLQIRAPGKEPGR